MLDNETAATPETGSATPTQQTPETASQGAPQEQPRTEDELLSSIYKEAMADESDGNPAPAPEAPTQPERDEKGRFLSKNSDVPADPAATTTEQAPQPEEKQEDAAEAEQAADEKKGGGGEFRGWSKEERDAFAKLSKDAQDFVLSRQRAVSSFYSQKVNELSNFARAASPFVEAIDRYGDYLDAVSADLGVPPQHVISNLMQTEATLRFGSFQEKARILQQMAEDYGVPLRMAEADPLADPTAPGGERYAEVHDLRQQNAQLQAQLRALSRGQQEAQRQSEEALGRQVASQFDHFRRATDPTTGQPRYPMLDLVQSHMGRLLASGEAQTLEDAYELATAPIRHAVSNAVTAKSHVTEARQAGRINVTTSPVPVEQYASEEEMLRAAYRQATAH